jgi:hypothetical protein
MASFPERIQSTKERKREEDIQTTKLSTGWETDRVMSATYYIVVKNLRLVS